MAAVVEHKTYAGAKCTRCHELTVRICILHDECEFIHHNDRECDEILNEIKKVRTRIERDLAWLKERGF